MQQVPRTKSARSEVHEQKSAQFHEQNEVHEVKKKYKTN